MVVLLLSGAVFALIILITVEVWVQQRDLPADFTPRRMYELDRDHGRKDDPCHSERSTSPQT
jgi:hypothetical protein